MRRPSIPHRGGRRVRLGRRRVVGAVGGLLAVLVVVWVVVYIGAGSAINDQPLENIESMHANTTPNLQPVSRPTTPVTFEEGCVSADCHSGFDGAFGVHTPVTERSCDTCHAPDVGNHVYPQLRPRDRVCSICHDTAGHQLFQHQAMSEDACLACHDPHAGKTEALLLGETLGATCIECHPASNGGTKHEPYEMGRCESCHDPHGAANSALLLGGEGADHCVQCHSSVVQETERGAASHADLRGSCLACHSAHSAEDEALLHAPPRDLCLSCHPSVREIVETATVSHDPVLEGRQCVSCHDPHSAKHPMMLVEDQRGVCLSCHDTALEANDGRAIPAMAEAVLESPVVHGAVRHGDCSACHSVHGGTHERLLREFDSGLPLRHNDARHFALCFECHDSRLAQAVGGTFFRDGDRNLHEVHLRGSDGSSACSACHVVHAGDLPRLIAENVDYEGSGWTMPMGYEMTVDGGSCAPSCHEPLSYRRTPLPRSIGGSP